MAKPRWSWLCPVSIIGWVVDFVWEIPGRIDDWNTWRKWICDLQRKGFAMPVVDVSDWVVIAVFLFGAIMWLRERRNSKQVINPDVQARRVEAKQWRELTARVKMLSDHLSREIETGTEDSEELSFVIQDAFTRLDDRGIPTPNFFGLDHTNMVYLKAFLVPLLIALENEDLEAAKAAIHRAGLPSNMIPAPRIND